jgi:hypothetical protein
MFDKTNIVLIGEPEKDSHDLTAGLASGSLLGDEPVD